MLKLFSLLVVSVLLNTVITLTVLRNHAQSNAEHVEYRINAVVTRLKLDIAELQSVIVANQVSSRMASVGTQALTSNVGAGMEVEGEVNHERKRNIDSNRSSASIAGVESADQNNDTVEKTIIAETVTELPQKTFDTINDDQREQMQKQERSLFADAFSLDEADDKTAMLLESILVEKLANSGDRAHSIDIQCRLTLCRVKTVNDNEQHAHEFEQLLASSIPWPAAVDFYFEPQQDGTVMTEIHFPTEGNTLPALDSISLM